MKHIFFLFLCTCFTIAYGQESSVNLGCES